MRPSLSVAEGDEAILVHCFAGCAPSDVVEVLRRRDLFGGRPTGSIRRTYRPSIRRTRDTPQDPDPDALAIWREAVTRGAILESYLEGRAIQVTPPSLRQGIHLKRGRVPIPTMVAAVQAPDRRVVAVQETFLTWRGQKAAILPRRTTGRLGCGAVRLAAAEEVLGLAEGVETALSAMKIYGVPVWASLGAQRLSRVGIPAGVSKLIIFCDNDAPGRAAGMAAVEAYTANRLQVELRLPSEGFNDFNDMLKPETSR